MIFQAHPLEQFFRWQWSLQKSLPWRWRCLCWLSAPKCPCRRWSCPECSARSIFQRKTRLEKEKRQQSTNITSWVRLDVIQYLFVCTSPVTHGSNYQPPHVKVLKLALSLRYGTNPIKRHKKRFQTFQSCSPVRPKKHRRTCGLGQVMVSVYLLVVNTTNPPVPKLILLGFSHYPVVFC